MQDDIFNDTELTPWLQSQKETPKHSSEDPMPNDVEQRDCLFVDDDQSVQPFRAQETLPSVFDTFIPNGMSPVRDFSRHLRLHFTDQPFETHSQLSYSSPRIKVNFDEPDDIDSNSTLIHQRSSIKDLFESLNPNLASRDPITNMARANRIRKRLWALTNDSPILDEENWVIEGYTRRFS